MSTASKKIMARLTKAEEEPRKSLSISFRVEDIQKLDMIAKAMTHHSGVTTTRNQLITESLQSYIEDAVTILEEEGIELDIDDGTNFDAVVFPAQMIDDYEQAFFHDHEWRYVRVAKSKISKIKYIAIYVGAPQSAITHYAKVAPNGFEYDKNRERYKIRLDGDPIELPNPIPLGSSSSLVVRSHKYTTLHKLFTVSEFRELYERD